MEQAETNAAGLIKMMEATNVSAIQHAAQMIKCII